MDFEVSVGKSERGWFKTESIMNWNCNSGMFTRKVIFLNHKEVLENKERLINFGKMEFLINMTLNCEGSICAQVNLQSETVLNSFEIKGTS